MGKASCIATAACVAVLHTSAPGAAEIKVLSSNALTEVMAELAPAFERMSEHKVVATYEPTNAVMNKIKNGEAFDVVMVIKQSVQELKTLGKLAAGSEADIARTSMGLAVRAGAPKPDIGTPEAFKRAMLAAKSVARSEIGASGIHFTRVLERLGITEEMKPKLKVVQGARPTATLIPTGEAEMAVQMMSELLPVAGVEVVGPLPGDLHYEIVLTAGVSAGAKKPAAATELIKFLSAPAAAGVLKQKGMQAP
jgi:molybdate transport system substrate-binding protein